MRTKRIFIILYIAFCFMLIFILRSPSYNKSVVDRDEGVYLLSGDAILHGGMPYREIWDPKGALLYFLYAFILKITGHSVLGLRLFTSLWIGLSAVLIFIIGRRLTDTAGGIFASLLFIAATSASDIGALASNSEVFYLLPVLAGVYIMLFLKSGPLYLLGAGIFLGLAFNIKSITIFDFLSLLLSIFFIKKNEGSTFRTAGKALIFCIGFLIPLAFIAGYFQCKGCIDYFIDIYFTAPFRYVSSGLDPLVAVEGLSKFLYANILILWGLCLLAALSIYSCIGGMYGADRRIRFLIVWLVFIIIGIMLHHRFFMHLFIQALPPLSILAGIFMSKMISSKINKALALALILCFGLEIFFVTKSNFEYFGRIICSGEKLKLNDTPARVSDYLRSRLKSSDYIYVVDYESVVYFLTGARVPTRYVYSFIYTDSEIWDSVLGVNAFEEMKKALSHKPSYVILSGRKKVGTKQFDSYLKKHLEENYALDKVIDGILIYRSKYKSG